MAGAVKVGAVTYPAGAGEGADGTGVGLLALARVVAMSCGLAVEAGVLACKEDGITQAG